MTSNIVGCGIQVVGTGLSYLLLEATRKAWIATLKGDNNPLLYAIALISKGMSITASSMIGSFVNAVGTPWVLSREISLLTLAPSILGTSLISTVILSSAAIRNLPK